MPTRTRVAPNKAGELGPFAVQFHDQLETHPDDYHTGSARNERLKTLTNEFQQKHAAQLAAQDAAKAAVAEKNAAQNALLDELSSLTRFVRGNDEVSDASLQRLGLKPRKTTRRPVRRPTGFPYADVMNTACLEHTLTIINPNGKTWRSKPRGVVGCEIYVAVSKTVPTNEADYRLAALATSRTSVVVFQADEGGQPAHYRLRWLNTRGEAGPFGPVISSTIPAV